jgi:chromosome segregation ATPase
MRIRRLEFALVLVLGAALIASVSVNFYQSRKLAEAHRQRDAALQSLKEVRDALHQADLRLAASHAAPKPPSDDKAAIARRDATIKQLSAEIGAAQASIKEFQEKLSEAKDNNEKAMANASQRYQKLQADWQNRVDALQTELNSAQADIQSSRQRIAGLEKSNAKLQADSSTRSTRVAEREHILTSLQELDRRRESYLTSIADRYRNITSQFRTMSGMLDSNRGPGSTSAFSGAALDLIQNALSQSDDDLQHLGDLNAKAFQLEKKLSRK